MITGTVARVIVAELTEDPLTRGYSGMNDAGRLTDLNTAYRERNKETMASHEIVQAVDQTEYAGLTDANKTLVWNLLGMGTLNPFGVEAGLFISAFGGGSDTIVALAAIRKESISRSEELIGKELSAAEWGKVIYVRDSA